MKLESFLTRNMLKKYNILNNFCNIILDFDEYITNEDYIKISIPKSIIAYYEIYNIQNLLLIFYRVCIRDMRFVRRLSHIINPLSSLLSLNLPSRVQERYVYIVLNTQTVLNVIIT